MLSLSEKARVRYHFGYPDTSMGASLAMGVPFDTQFMFLLQRAMDLILPEAEEIARMLIGRLDQIDEAIFQCQIRMQASKVDNIELNPRELADLEDLYYHQVTRLADLFHAPLYPFSARFQGRNGLQTGTQVGMIPRIS